MYSDYLFMKLLCFSGRWNASYYWMTSCDITKAVYWHKTCIYCMQCAAEIWYTKKMHSFRYHTHFTHVYTLKHPVCFICNKQFTQCKQRQTSTPTDYYHTIPFTSYYTYNQAIISPSCCALSPHLEIIIHCNKFLECV